MQYSVLQMLLGVLWGICCGWAGIVPGTTESVLTINSLLEIKNVGEKVVKSSYEHSIAPVESATKARQFF